MKVEAAFEAVVVHGGVGVGRGGMFGEAERVAIPGYRARDVGAVDHDVRETLDHEGYLTSTRRR